MIGVGRRRIYLSTPGRAPSLGPSYLTACASLQPLDRYGVHRHARRRAAVPLRVVRRGREGELERASGHQGTLRDGEHREHERVVFNLKGNRYRVIVAIKYEFMDDVHARKPTPRSPGARQVAARRSSAREATHFARMRTRRVVTNERRRPRRGRGRTAGARERIDGENTPGTFNAGSDFLREE